jgi:hypothetical protein
MTNIPGVVLEGEDTIHLGGESASLPFSRGDPSSDVREKSVPSVEPYVR